jgi:hypothetical protein
MDDSVYGGYTRKQLTDAFELVRPAGDWKLEIDATAPAGTDRELVTTAVIFFTGSVPDYEANEDGSFRVVADGYYIAVGS